MSNVVSIEEFKQRKAAEHKIHTAWIPKFSDKVLEKLRQAGAMFRKTIQEASNARKLLK